MTILDKDRASLATLRSWREAVPNDRNAHLVKDLLRGMSRALHIRLMDHSVSLGYWAFLRILWERDGMTQRELSVLAGVSEPTTYSALQAMEKLGYVTRRKLPDNKRNISVCLTAHGKALRSRLVPLAEEVNAIAVQGIAEKDIANFRKTLMAMMTNLERDEAESKRRLPPLRRVA